MVLSIGKGNDESGEDELLSRKRLQVVIIVVLLFSAVLFAWIGGMAEEVDTDNRIIKAKVTKRNDAADGICYDLCRARRGKRNEHFGGDLLDRKELLQLATTAKAGLISKLHVDYGADNFENIFVDKEANENKSGYMGFGPVAGAVDSESMKRLKRKLQIKVLSMQASLKKTDSNVNGCDCINGDKALVEKIENLTAESMHIDPTYARYVWATGGHSASAGHGNMFNESYTAFLESDMKGVFGSIGIEFEGRNYAMGGTGSGAEISMCSEQIFGSDIDFITWDYGMTDGNYPERLLHFGYRGGINPGRPAYLTVHVGGRAQKNREGCLTDLEEMGMAVFSEYKLSEMRQGVPDTFGKSEEEISKMPEYVRNLKCNGKWEDGEPYCRNEKFSKYMCTPRGKQTSWHPGFKSHAMDGHALGLFLVQAFISALKDLAEHSNQDPEMLLAQLQSEEDQLYQGFVQATLPGSAAKLHTHAEKDPEADLDVIFKGASICHTGRMPAQTRYLGYLTNSDKVGDAAPFGKETYDTGIDLKIANSEDANGVMGLTYIVDGDREKCPVTLKPDYKDFFYAHQKDGLTKLTFPNEAEKAAYRYSQSEFKGLIAVFFTVCDWGKCAPGDLKDAHFAEGKFEMTVNGKSVKSLYNFGFGCLFLKGDEGLYWQRSSNDDYEIAVIVKEPKSFVKISSVVLY